MLRNLALVVIAVVALAYALSYAAGSGLFSEEQHAGVPAAGEVSDLILQFKLDATRESALDVGERISENGCDLRSRKRL